MNMSEDEWDWPPPMTDTDDPGPDPCADCGVFDWYGDSCGDMRWRCRECIDRNPLVMSVEYWKD